MSSLADYTDRVYDVFAFHGVKDVGEAALTQEMLDVEGGLICTGVQKLAQAFLITFLTEQGSIPYDPDEGTTFMIQLRRGELRTETDVQIAFSFAVGQLLRLFSRDPAAAADETLTRVDLLRVTVSAGGVSLTVKLTTADPQRQAILPIGISI